MGRCCCFIFNPLATELFPCRLVWSHAAPKKSLCRSCSAKLVSTVSGGWFKVTNYSQNTSSFLLLAAICISEIRNAITLARSFIGLRAVGEPSRTASVFHNSFPVWITQEFLVWGHFYCNADDFSLSWRRGVDSQIQLPSRIPGYWIGLTPSTVIHLNSAIIHIFIKMF